MPARTLRFAPFVVGLVLLAGCQPSVERTVHRPAPTPRPTMPPVAPVAPPIPLVADREIAPGVRWRQFSGISPRFKAPLFANVLEFDPRDARYRLAVLPSHGRAPSFRESTRRIAAKAGALAAINGSYFEFRVTRTNGDPIGLVVSDGRVLNPARGDRPALGILEDGRVFFGIPSRKRDAATALQLRRLAALSEPEPAVAPSPAPKRGPMERLRFALGTFAHRQTAAAATPSAVPERLRNGSGLGYPWNEAVYALEGGPTLLHEGKPAPLHGFNWSILHGREPRTAVGLTRAGTMLWITVDGRRPGHSMGTDLEELTRLFQSLGAVEALNWDGGGSTTMVINGAPVTRIATGWVREVTNAMVLIRNPEARP